MNNRIHENNYFSCSFGTLVLSQRPSFLQKATNNCK